MGNDEEDDLPPRLAPETVWPVRRSRRVPQPSKSEPSPEEELKAFLGNSRDRELGRVEQHVDPPPAEEIDAPPTLSVEIIYPQRSARAPVTKSGKVKKAETVKSSKPPRPGVGALAPRQSSSPPRPGVGALAPRPSSSPPRRESSVPPQSNEAQDRRPVSRPAIAPPSSSSVVETSLIRIQGGLAEEVVVRKNDWRRDEDDDS